MRFLIPLLLVLQLGATDAADDMPAWAIPGILAVETQSAYRSDGTIAYTDRRIGAAGELGCCQITPAAFRLVRNHTELFSQLRDKPLLCVDVAKRYLRWIYEHKANRDWLRAVGMYNAGFGTDRRSMNRRVAYLNKVRNASNAWNN